MDLLSRGVDVFKLLHGGVLLLALVWGGNRFLLHNTTADIGWPVIVGVTVLLTSVVVGLLHLTGRSVEDASYRRRPKHSYDWNNNK